VELRYGRADEKPGAAQSPLAQSHRRVPEDCAGTDQRSKIVPDPIIRPRHEDQRNQIGEQDDQTGRMIPKMWLA
jgi:hypothetical protein